MFAVVYDERWLQDLLYHHPELIPIEEGILAERNWLFHCLPSWHTSKRRRCSCSRRSRWPSATLGCPPVLIPVPPSMHRMLPSSKRASTPLPGRPSPPGLSRAYCGISRRSLDRDSTRSPARLDPQTGHPPHEFWARFQFAKERAFATRLPKYRQLAGGE